MPAQAERLQRLHRIELLQKIMGDNLNPEQLKNLFEEVEAGWRKEGELNPGQPLDVETLRETLDK